MTACPPAIWQAEKEDQFLMTTVNGSQNVDISSILFSCVFLIRLLIITGLITSSCEELSGKIKGNSQEKVKTADHEERCRADKSL